MTDQPKRTLEEARVNEAKVLANDPCLLPFATPEIIHPNGLLLVQYLNAAFSTPILCTYSESCHNYMSYHQISQDFGLFLGAFLLPYFLYFHISAAFTPPKYGKQTKLKTSSYPHPNVVYGQKKNFGHSEAF